jgi:acetoin utilization deacetylase AcuC-like enzyme
MGPDHPESPLRLKAIQDSLLNAPFAAKLDWREPQKATPAQLKRVHYADYVDHLFAIAPKEGYWVLDPDTIMNPFTLSAALLASGAQVNAVDEIFQGKLDRAFCLVRPPGHHAEPDKAMGFCFFNNVAVGVAHALEVYHCQRVAIVDFDVHHGNGTESMFREDPRVCFWSSFQHPFYPGTRLNNQPSHIHLCPLAAGTGSSEFRQKIELELIPALEAFKPECIFISAGFDAHQLDPLANLRLTTQDYHYVTRILCDIANQFCGGKIISTLEGGYHLKALAESVLTHVDALRAP